jgi:hypothetical protein
MDEDDDMNESKVRSPPKRRWMQILVKDGKKEKSRLE